ncbi:hypothetical protein [Acidovorax sp.]|uniref:hypothetical protein n=1 Tax=Acidovorax sp. TaxID=1872122 RepID=UPI002619EDCA|nr:hypothetical protein [Acidovorax sp.]
MSGAIFVFVSLGALAIFILWEAWPRHRTAKKPLRRSEMKQGFDPGASARELALFVASGVFAVFGFFLLIEPSYPPFHGRNALIEHLLFAWLGIYGNPVACWACALIAFVAAISMRRKRLRRAR